jgi:hypothetical protein
MTLTKRDRRALMLLGGAVLLMTVYLLWPDGSDATVAAVAPSGRNSVGAAEKQLAQLREIAATVPAKEDVKKGVAAELAVREKGLIVADTAAQAQAQLIQIVRQLARAETPPIEIRSTELGGLRPLGDAYAQVDTAVMIECRIDQLINLLAALAARPELISTSDLRITSSNSKDKIVGVRLGVIGIVPRRLIPEKEKKGGSA